MDACLEKGRTKDCEVQTRMWKGFWVVGVPDQTEAKGQNAVGACLGLHAEQKSKPALEKLKCRLFFIALQFLGLAFLSEAIRHVAQCTEQQR